MPNLVLKDPDKLKLNLKGDPLKLNLGGSTVANLALRALTADKLTTGRTIGLHGAVSGQAYFDGSEDIVIETTIEAMDVHPTSYWNEHRDYVPDAGEMVIYTDRTVIDGVAYPGIKIGDGSAYVVDLPFLGDDVTDQIVDVLNNHVNNTDIHVTPEEKAFWNAKLNYETQGETLVFTRN